MRKKIQKNISLTMALLMFALQATPTYALYLNAYLHDSHVDWYGYDYCYYNIPEPPAPEYDEFYTPTYIPITATWLDKECSDYTIFNIYV